jgi:hypothetical protein
MTLSLALPTLFCHGKCQPGSRTVCGPETGAQKYERYEPGHSNPSVERVPPAPKRACASLGCETRMWFKLVYVHNLNIRMHLGPFSSSLHWTVLRPCFLRLSGGFRPALIQLFIIAVHSIQELLSPLLLHRVDPASRTLYHRLLQLQGHRWLRVAAPRCQISFGECFSCEEIKCTCTIDLTLLPRCFYLSLGTISIVKHNVRIPINNIYFHPPLPLA